MENEDPNSANEFMILDSSIQPGDGLDYDRKTAQAAMEGKPFVLLFGCTKGRGERTGLLPSYRNRDAVVCYVDIANCRNKSLRSYMQLIGLDGRSDEDSWLNGTAQIFTVSRNQSGGLVLHSTGSPTYNVRENCEALNEQLRVIKALLSPEQQNQQVEVTPLSVPGDLPLMAALPAPDLSFAPAFSPEDLMQASGSPVPSADACVIEPCAVLEWEDVDPASEAFRQQIGEYARQWLEIHQEALKGNLPGVVGGSPAGTDPTMLE